MKYWPTKKTKHHQYLYEELPPEPTEREVYIWPSDAPSTRAQKIADILGIRSLDHVDKLKKLLYIYKCQDTGELIDEDYISPHFSLRPIGDKDDNV